MTFCYSSREWATFEVTVRVIDGRYFFQPSGDLNQIVLGCLGRALELNPDNRVELLAVMSGHYHLLLQSRSATARANFLRHLNTNLAKEANRRLDRRGPVFDKTACIEIVPNEAKHRERFRYLLAHGVKEGLVRRPEEWPGVNCVGTLCHGDPLEGIWYDRKGFHDRKTVRSTIEDFATPYTIELTPPPFWAHLPVEQRQAEARHLVEEIVAEGAARNRAMRRRPIGVAKVLRRSAWSKPRRPPERRRVPLCHAATPTERKAFRDLYRAFSVRREIARVRLETHRAGCGFPKEGYLPRSCAGLDPPG